jgi:ATP-dependent protease ClpP protease subunit
MHNTGAIDSIATVIFHAADERYAAPHASFLFHGITWNFDQGQTLYRNEIEEIRSVIQ